MHGSRSAGDVCLDRRISSNPGGGMNDHTQCRRLSRREFVRAGLAATGAATLSPVAVPLLPVSPAFAQPRIVPRNRTLTLVWSGSREGRWIDYELWNPYAVGSNHQNGPGILC